MRDEPEIIKEMKIYEKYCFQDNNLQHTLNQDISKSSVIGPLSNPCQNTSHKVERNNFEIYNKITNENYDLFKSMIEDLFEGILVINEQKKIVYINHSLKKMIGLSKKDEVVGKDVLSIIDAEYHEIFLENYNFAGSRYFINSYELLKKDGSSIWIECIGCKQRYDNEFEQILFIRDISQKRKTWDRLRYLEKRYKAIADMLADGIIILDPLGKISYVNPSFQKMAQKKEQALLDTLFREHVSDESIYIIQQLLIKARKTKKILRHVEIDLQSNNVIFPVELSISPVYEKDTFTSYVCTIQDITERKTFEEEIKKSERLKTEFMNIAAHELKSPVTPIKGYLELIISDKESNEKIKKWAKISLRNAERLLILVNDILDVSRLDNDTMKFEMRKINAKELIEEIIEDYKPAIEDKQLLFDLQIKQPLPNILGDYHRLNQVLKNLFTNAIKFTDYGSITLSAGQTNQELVISVKDTGAGVNSEDVNNIFKKFYQAETCDSRKNEGTGLGLFICKEILTKHNGSISVESVQGEGSKFTVKLPIL